MFADKTLTFTLLSAHFSVLTSQFVFRFGADFQVLSSQFEIGSVEREHRHANFAHRTER